MYLIALGPRVYEHRGGGTFTLTEALRELRGVGQARILRTDGTVAVRDAGNDRVVVHGPTGRPVYRGPRRRRTAM